VRKEKGQHPEGGVTICVPKEGKGGVRDGKGEVLKTSGRQTKLESKMREFKAKKGLNEHVGASARGRVRNKKIPGWRRQAQRTDSR